jgi:hypothetical protein
MPRAGVVATTICPTVFELNYLIGMSKCAADG